MTLPPSPISRRRSRTLPKHINSPPTSALKTSSASLPAPTPDPSRRSPLKSKPAAAAAANWSVPDPDPALPPPPAPAPSPVSKDGACPSILHRDPKNSRKLPAWSGGGGIAGGLLSPTSRSRLPHPAAAPAPAPPPRFPPPPPPPLPPPPLLLVGGLLEAAWSRCRCKWEEKSR